MQKKLIAAAVAGLLSAGAYAAENVQLYGVQDVYIGQGSATNSKSHTVINSGGLSGTRFGMTGSEDLGNNLKAVFRLEYGIGSGSNQGEIVGNASNSSVLTVVGRQQYVGLAGDFGTVAIGGLQTTAYDWACAYSPIGGSTIDAAGNNYASSLLSCGTAGRLSNAIAYMSPNFSGFTFAVNHARLSENTNANNNVKDGTGNMLSARYKNGPLDVGAVWAGAKIYDAAGVSAKANEWGLGASYDFSVVKLFAAVNQRKDKIGTGGKDTEYNLGVSVPVGAGSIVAQYNQTKDKTMPVVGDETSVKGKQYTLAYLHSLSKRTTAYAGYAQRKASSSVDNTTVNSNLLVQTCQDGNACSNSPSSKALIAGVRHTF